MKALFFSLLMVPLSLMASESTKLITNSLRHPNQPIVIQNISSEKHIIMYAYGSSARNAGLTIVPEELMLVDSVSGNEEIALLQVIPIEGYWIGKKMRPENLCRKFNLLLDPAQKKHPILQINESNDIALLDMPISMISVGWVSPDYLKAAQELPRKVPLEAFPHVAYTIKQGRIPLPRHYLSLPKDHIDISGRLWLEAAYERLISTWGRRTDLSPLLVKKIIEIIGKAYIVLKIQLDIAKSAVGQRLLNQGLPLSITTNLERFDDTSIRATYNNTMLHLASFGKIPLLKSLTTCLATEFELVMLKNNLDRPPIVESNENDDE